MVVKGRVLAVGEDQVGGVGERQVLLVGDSGEKKDKQPYLALIYKSKESKEPIIKENQSTTFSPPPSLTKPWAEMSGREKVSTVVLPTTVKLAFCSVLFNRTNELVRSKPVIRYSETGTCEERNLVLLTIKIQNQNRVCVPKA